MGLLDPHGPTSLTPRAGRTEAPALLKPSLGLGAIGFRLVLPCLGLGTIEYYWIQSWIPLILRRSFLRQIQKLYYNWRNVETHQNSAVWFGTFRHISAHPSWWRGLRDEFAPLSGLGLAEVFPVLNALSWAAIIQNASNHLDRCGEVMGIGDHHGHFEWVYYQFENVWKNNLSYFDLR